MSAVRRLSLGSLLPQNPNGSMSPPQEVIREAVLLPKVHQVYLVDDHPLVLEWLAHLVDQQRDFAVCGACQRAPDALEAITRLRPDVAVVDIRFPDGDSGLHLIEAITRQSPSTAVLAFTILEEGIYGKRALRAGVRGYVMKRQGAKHLIDAIRTVLNGECYFNR